MNKKHPFYNTSDVSRQGNHRASSYSEDNSQNISMDNLPPFAPNETKFGGLFPDDADENFGEDGIPGFEKPGASLSESELGALCKERVCPTCSVAKEAADVHLRAMADLENAKKRLAREREQMIKFATEGVLDDIIPALDNLDLALQHVSKDEVCKNFAVGVEMTKKLLLESLKRHGLEEIGQVGQSFDPALHEAVGVADVPEVPADHIASLLSKGYSLHGRLLRPAKVMVSKHS